MGVLLVEQQVRKVLRYADRAYVMRRGRIEMPSPRPKRSLGSTRSSAAICPTK